MSKELEALERLSQISLPVCQEDEDCLTIIKKSLKALEIIKEKICSVRNDVGMICDKNNIHYQIVINQLTQEEYDLLKEVLK